MYKLDRKSDLGTLFRVIIGEERPFDLPFLILARASFQKIHVWGPLPILCALKLCCCKTDAAAAVVIERAPLKRFYIQLVLHCLSAAAATTTAMYYTAAAASARPHSDSLGTFTKLRSLLLLLRHFCTHTSTIMMAAYCARQLCASASASIDDDDSTIPRIYLNARAGPTIVIWLQQQMLLPDAAALAV